MNVSLTPVETVDPAWIDSTCLCVNAHPATVVPSVTLTYAGYIFIYKYILFIYLHFWRYTVHTGPEMYMSRWPSNIKVNNYQN